MVPWNAGLVGLLALQRRCPCGGEGRAGPGADAPGGVAPGDLRRQVRHASASDPGAWRCCQVWDVSRSWSARSTAHGGHRVLPPGHWVYVAPCWYICATAGAISRDPGTTGAPSRRPEPPDTPGAGDIVTAWASATPDGQDEWLLLEYAEPVVPTAVLVHETYNPGALVRVTAFRLDGREVEVWQGRDPTPVGAGRGVSEIKFKAGFKTNRVRIHLASPRMPGWNEIDAVGLRDTEGKVHWARTAEASSTYGSNRGALPGIAPPPFPRKPGVAPRPRPGRPPR